MAWTPERLHLYGAPSDAAPLEWTWVEEQLVGAGTYWVVPRGDGHPHPRPVWGVWSDDTLFVSVGSPVVARQLRAEPDVTVHLDSGVDVVVVEGRCGGESDDADVLRRYDAKYDWHYDLAEYGPFTRIVPARVLAWRSAGWAGRDGFRAVGRWRFEAPASDPGTD